MSGETELHVSGWTVDTLKQHTDSELRHAVEIRALDRGHFAEIQKLERELREAKEKYDDSHFAQLNENAKRTIEERGHFVSIEAYNPFQRQVLDALSNGLGQKAGAREVIAYITGVGGLLLALVVYLTR